MRLAFLLSLWMTYRRVVLGSFQTTFR